MEDQTFTNIQRAQINTASFKPCTYLATKIDDGTKVFVKGPFPTIEEASVATEVMEVKKQLAGETLPFIDCEIMELVPNALKDTPLGTRVKLRKSGKPCFFQVWEDLVAPIDTIKTKEKSSKVWHPVQVIDWESVRPRFLHWYNEKEYEKTPFVMFPDEAKQFVLHILLSWILGCGGDIALRNFIMDTYEHLTYQVDLEVWCNWDWKMYNTLPGRGRAGVHFMNFVNEQYESFIKGHLENWLDKGPVALSKLSWKDAEIAMQRLIDLQSVQGIAKLFESEPKKRKRDEEKTSQSIKKSKNQ